MTVNTELAVYRPTNAGTLAQLPPDTTDAHLVELWATWPRRANNRRTVEQYRRVGLTFLDAITKPLQAVTAVDLKEWAATLTGAPSTKRLQVNAVRSLFAFALRLGYLALNPAVTIAPPPAHDTKHTRILTEAEVIRLIDAASSPRDRAFLHTLYSSGARVSELCALRWADVEPSGHDRAVLHITGKGGKPRTAGISAAAYAELRPLQGAAAALVFAIDRTTAHRIVKRAARAAGLTKPVSAHWLRHSHVSHALARNASTIAVQAQVGHASLATTTGYAHADRYSSDYLVV